jgi:hypothetical protein
MSLILGLFRPAGDIDTIVLPLFPTRGKDLLFLFGGSMAFLGCFEGSALEAAFGCFEESAFEAAFGCFEGSAFEAAFGCFEGSALEAAFGCSEGSAFEAAFGCSEGSAFEAAFGCFDGSALLEAVTCTTFVEGALAGAVACSVRKEGSSGTLSSKGTAAFKAVSCTWGSFEGVSFSKFPSFVGLIGEFSCDKSNKTLAAFFL